MGPLNNFPNTFENVIIRRSNIKMKQNFFNNLRFGGGW